MDAPVLNATPLTVSRAGSDMKFPALALGVRDRVLVLGPSGCGKTTWLAALAGLLPPTAGQVHVDGMDLYALPARRRDRLRGARFGFVFQTLHLLPALTLRQNIMLAASMAGQDADRTRVDELLERLGLADKAQRRPRALSQGEQQRAAIARAVMNRPALIVADEPTAALDDRNAQIVMDLLESCAAETGSSLLVATHDSRIAPRFERKIDMTEAA